MAAASAVAGAPLGMPIGDRQIPHDLKFISAVLRWATMAGDGAGGVLLDRNPCSGFPMGVNDPNMITGLKAVVHGVARGKAVSDAMQPGTTNHVMLK